MKKIFVAFIACAFFLSIAFAGTVPAINMIYTSLAPRTYYLAAEPGDVDCPIYPVQTLKYRNARMIEVTSSEKIFGEGNYDLLRGPYAVESFLYDPVGLTDENGAIPDGYYTTDEFPGKSSPKVFWNVLDRDCWNWDYVGDYSEDNTITVKVGGQVNNKDAYSITILKLDKNGILAGGIDPGFAGALQLNEIAVGTSAASTYNVKSVMPVYVPHDIVPKLEFKLPRDSGLSVYYHPFYYVDKPGLHYFSFPYITERGTRYSEGQDNYQVAVTLTKQAAMPEFSFYRRDIPQTGHVFKTLISDSIDRTPANRDNNLPEDGYPASMSSIDTGGAITSPLRGIVGESSTLGSAMGLSDIASKLYRIGPENYVFFRPFGMKLTIVNDYSKRYLNFKELQSFWAGSTPFAVAYHSSQFLPIMDVGVDRMAAVAYSLKFEGEGEFGLPVCGWVVQGFPAGDYSSCNDYDKLGAESYVQIKFLNEYWRIIEMNPPAKSLPSSTSVASGGKIVMQKLNADGSWNYKGQKLVLEDGKAPQYEGAGGMDLGYRVSLLWKNKERNPKKAPPASDKEMTAHYNQPDSLREIVVYRLFYVPYQKLLEGHTIDFMPGKHFTLEYKGFDYSFSSPNQKPNPKNSVIEMAVGGPGDEFLPVEGEGKETLATKKFFSTGKVFEDALPLSPKKALLYRKALAKPIAPKTAGSDGDDDALPIVQKKEFLQKPAQTKRAVEVHVDDAIPLPVKKAALPVKPAVKEQADDALPVSVKKAALPVKPAVKEQADGALPVSVKKAALPVKPALAQQAEDAILLVKKPAISVYFVLGAKAIPLAVD